MDTKQPEKSEQQETVKGWNVNTVKLGGVFYEPRPQDHEDGPHDFPAGKGLDSLVEMKAVTLVGQRRKAEPATTDGKPKP